MRPDGHMHDYRYDLAGRLIAVRENGKVLQRYVYGADRRRLLAYDEDKNGTAYVWDGSTVIAEYDVRKNQDAAWRRFFVRDAGGVLAATARVATGDEMTRFYTTERGRTRMIADSSGAAPTVAAAPRPYGTDAAAVPAEFERLENYRRNATTGLDYATNRDYDPQIGRFLQIDPLGLTTSNMTNPQSLNLYTYSLNDPTNLTDPLGLKPPALDCSDSNQGATAKGDDGRIYVCAGGDHGWLPQGGQTVVRDTRPLEVPYAGPIEDSGLTSNEVSSGERRHLAGDGGGVSGGSKATKSTTAPPNPESPLACYNEGSSPGNIEGPNVSVAVGIFGFSSGTVSRARAIWYVITNLFSTNPLPLLEPPSPIVTPPPIVRPITGPLPPPSPPPGGFILSAPIGLFVTESLKFSPFSRYDCGPGTIY
jgi:RHS repeat-associated protein